MIGQPIVALPPLQDIPFSDFPLQLPSRIRDPHARFHHQKGPVRVLASEHQCYLHLLLPYHQGLFPRWWALRWMHEVEELEKRPAHLELSCSVGLQNTSRSEKRPAHQELFFQVCALDIRRRQDWVEIEYTFPLEHFLSDAQMRAARDLAGLDLALWERFCEIGATDICQNAEEDALMEWMVRLHAMVAERMVHPLLCGDVRDLKAISSFVRADLEKMERFRSPSGFVELVFDQEVQQFLCDFEEMRLHGDADLAHESLQEMLHRYPQHAALQEIAARESLDQQNPRRALQHLQRALLDDCFPRKDRLFLLRAKAHQALHQDHDALQELEQALLQNPAQMDVWLIRAEIFLQQRQYDRAQHCLDSLREQAPAWRGLCYQYALLAQHQGLLKEALDAFRAEVEFHPDHQEAISAVLDLAQQRGDHALYKLYARKRDRLAHKQRKSAVTYTSAVSFEDLEALCCQAEAWFSSPVCRWKSAFSSSDDSDAFGADAYHDEDIPLEDALHLMDDTFWTEASSHEESFGANAFSSEESAFSRFDAFSSEESASSRFDAFSSEEPTSSRFDAFSSEEPASSRLLEDSPASDAYDAARLSRSFGGFVAPQKKHALVSEKQAVKYPPAPEKQAIKHTPASEKQEVALPAGCFAVDDSFFVRIGSFRYRGIGIAYEGATYRISMVFRHLDIPWPQLQLLAFRRDVARLLIEREGDEVIVLLRLFPSPHLDVQQWLSRWGFGEVPLIAECLEPSEIRCSPSARWDQLYRRLLAVMMDDVRGALLRGDLRPLREISLWLQGIRPESHPQIPRSTGLSARRGSCSKDNPVALQFSSILEQLFAYTPANQRLSLGLQTHLRADDLGLLPGLFTPHPESKLLPIEEIRLLASHDPLAAFSRLSQYTLQYRLSSAIYALKSEFCEALLRALPASLDASTVRSIQSRALLLQDSF